MQGSGIRAKEIKILKLAITLLCREALTVLTQDKKRFNEQ